MKLVLFLLCGGLVHFTFASNRLRIFSYNSTRGNWTYSLNECKNRNESLVTLYDKKDAEFSQHFLIEIHKSDHTSAWLGLRKVRNTSNGDNVNFSKVTDVTKGEQRCVAITDNTWTLCDCSEAKPFMCSRGKNYTLIDDKNLTWCQALQHCRNHFSDLVSISDEEQNQAVIEKGENKTFWIGHMYDEWKWQDNGCSSYREWNGQTIEMNHNCTYFHYNPLNPYECEQHKPTFCSKGSVRIKVINESKTWEEAFEYCETNHTHLLEIWDDQDQKAVEQWLNRTGADRTFWIGLRQSRLFGFWIWSDMTVNHSNWRGGHAPEMTLSKHCGVIKTNDYKWHEEDCSVRHHFLCEEDIIYMEE